MTGYSDLFSDEVFRRATGFGGRKIEEIASYIEWWCRRRPATGVFGDDLGARHLWDEFCIDRSEGPCDAMENVWRYDLRMIALERYQNATEDERCFMMLSARLDYGNVTRDLLDPFLFERDLFEQAIFAALCQKAGQIDGGN